MNRHMPTWESKLITEAIALLERPENTTLNNDYRNALRIVIAAARPKTQEEPVMSENLPNYPGHPDDWTDEQWSHYKKMERKVRKKKGNPVIQEALARGDYTHFAYQLRYHGNPWNYKRKHIRKALPIIDRLGYEGESRG